MKTGTYKFSVGLVGFLQHRTAVGAEGLRTEPITLVGFPEKPDQTPDYTERNRWSGRLREPTPLRRCGALVCRTCCVHSPRSHREGCPCRRFDPCRSRWFWLSPHGAIKCVACSGPLDLTRVEGWVLACETGEGEDGWRVPSEILSLLHIASPPQ